MSSKTLYYCDNCKKEIKIKEFNSIGINSFSKNPISFSLCNICLKKMLKEYKHNE